MNPASHDSSLYKYQAPTISTLLTYVNNYIETILIEYQDAESDNCQVSKLAAKAQCARLLWVTANKAALTQLKTQLYSNSNDEHNTATSSGTDKHLMIINNAHLTTITQLAQQTTLTRYQLVCFWLPDLSAESMSQYLPLMMRYRDLYAEHLLVLVNDAIDLRAYGLTPLDRLTDTSLALTLWQFNFYDYKPLPDWLNSKYWANPEQWDKSRW